MFKAGEETLWYSKKSVRNKYLLSSLREVKEDKISDLQNNINKSKQMRVSDITTLSLQGTVISGTGTAGGVKLILWMFPW